MCEKVNKLHLLDGRGDGVEPLGPLDPQRTLHHKARHAWAFCTEHVIHGVLGCGRDSLQCRPRPVSDAVFSTDNQIPWLVEGD